jgi:hypothetical protein
MLCSIDGRILATNMLQKEVVVKEAGLFRSAETTMVKLKDDDEIPMSKSQMLAFLEECRQRHAFLSSAVIDLAYSINEKQQALEMQAKFDQSFRDEDNKKRKVARGCQCGGDCSSPKPGNSCTCFFDKKRQCNSKCGCDPSSCGNRRRPDNVADDDVVMSTDKQGKATV